MTPNILLLSSYDIDSHRRWRKGLVAEFPEYRWIELALPPRYFRWRIRGNPISWYLEQSQALKKSYDMVIATSTVDIATLRGLFPHLGQAPLLVYFHENQLAYPHSAQQHASIDPAMVNIYSALAADAVVFNSEYNRHSFLEGLHKLINKLPDHVGHQLADIIDRKASVLCVPLEDHLFSQPQSCLSQTDQQNELTILWNHRVEYDKGVDEFLELLERLNNVGLRYKLILLGQRFRKLPKSWHILSEQFANHILVDEYAATRAVYYSWVQRADIVVSTALHEFQGLAVMEACAMGCVPLVPDRLCYPEFFTEEYCYQNLDEAVRFLLLQGQIKALVSEAGLQAPDLHFLSWKQQKINYQDLIQRLLRIDKQAR